MSNARDSSLGTRTTPGSSLFECPDCAGLGWRFLPWAGDTACPEADDCPTCDGTGSVAKPVSCGHECSRCGAVSVGEIADGALFECPGCGIVFTARFARAA